ncbi:MAG: TraB/GumN family protein [Candidatus Nanosalina sp.]
MRKDIELEGRRITVVGTAHVSSESRKEVREVIEEEDPDRVCVELDQRRYDSLRDESGWKDLNLVEAIREGEGFMLFLNLFLSIYQRKLGLEQNVKPGEELLEAVNVAEENGIEYSLVDRDINETFSRAISQLTFWEKIKLLTAAYTTEEEMDVEDLKEDNILNTVIKELEEEFPTVKRTFLDERNTYMAEKILEDDFDHAVVVVGAAHVEGLIEELKKEEEDREEEERDPGFSVPWLKIMKYGLPTFIILMLMYSFYRIGFATGVELTVSWILINGILAMGGAMLARSHVATWIVSFISAPLTSLDPALGAGMVASYFEGKFYPPTVEELEDVTKITSYAELWNNQAGRILLTFFFVTLGSAAATFIAAFHIFSVLAIL